MNQFVETVKHVMKRTPVLGHIASLFYSKLITRKFPGSKEYWIKRYAKGETSGCGSYNELAEFKAEILEKFTSEHKIKTVIEYGCGDGNQLRLAKYENYLGFDVSPEAISTCKKIFHNDKTKKFKLVEEYAGERADLTLSLDVIYHLIEEDVFSSYMKRLFSSADQFVVIYSSDTDEQEKVQQPHIRHRKFTKWVEVNIDGWKLTEHILNRYPYKKGCQIESFADFYIYKKPDAKER
jgi:SAM-dependent methyltransferase